MIEQWNGFSVARLPRIEFGSGAISKLPAIIDQYGKRVLLVTGGSSFVDGPYWQLLQQQFIQNEIEWHLCQVSGEPSPQLVDEAVKTHADKSIDVVIGIGGGSPLDAAKAIAGLLRVKLSVMDFLEGVGPELPYDGPSVPFIAVPTTAGTGSEATKNAVLSVQGSDGFKKSFRDDKLVAEYAIVDPELLSTCPAGIIAANGMDALTQLLESYVSIKANPLNDSLAVSGLRAARDGLLQWHEQAASPEHTAEYRSKMAYAAMLSGINLAQTGLGSVHGLASPLGAFYPIPHGVVCGTLVAEATRVNIETMLQRETDNPALARYARAGEILCQRRFPDMDSAWQGLIDLLIEWTERMQLARLSDYGVDKSGLDQVVAHSRGSSMKTNPIVLQDAEIREILEKRM
jgi:alcohol dehydrogenase